MEHSGEQQLLELLARPANGVRIGERMAAIETVVAELLGGSRYDRRGAIRGPDLVVAGPNRPPMAIELKVLRRSTLGRNFNNRVAELLSAAVETRRSFHERVSLGAVLLIAVDDKHWSSDDSSRITSSVRRLLRAKDGVGYDSVLLGIADQELQWYLFAATDVESSRQDIPPAPVRIEEAAAALRSQSPVEFAHPEPEPQVRRRRVLLVADEWRSGRGGISTVNRELAIALAKAGADVAVMVPSASDEDVKTASEANVSLVKPARVPGLSERELLMLRPVFADEGWEPDVIVGHGRVLGPYAAALQQQFFENARRVHFVHMDAEQLEAAKETLGGPSNMGKSDPRRGLERELAQSAHLVVGIGPLLTASIQDDLTGPGQQPRVMCLVPGLRAGFVVDPQRPPVRNQLLIVGRADDFQSKGIDIAAEALLTIVDRWPQADPHPPSLVIRGVPDELASSVKERLDSIFEGRVAFHLRPYSDSEEAVTRDMAQAKVVLMPSRHEGFGLAAYEAIASGVPVLVSANSGLAMFLRQADIDTTPSSIVATRNSATCLAVDHWVDAIEEVLRDPHGARTRAALLRDQVEGVVSWDQSAKLLMAEFDDLI